jgi:hypothetical protein
MKKNQKGLTAIEGSLILILVCIVVFTGWYVWHSKNSANNSYNNSANTNSITPSNKISSFNECKSAAGSKVETTYPEICVTKDGKKFTQTGSVELP